MLKGFVQVIGKANSRSLFGNLFKAIFIIASAFFSGRSGKKGKKRSRKSSCFFVTSILVLSSNYH